MSNDEAAERTSAQRAIAAALPGTTTQAVFIDSRSPDIADLINGALPSEQTFILDPTQDGFDQIASIKADDLAGLSAISIIGHGASGEIDLGSAVIAMMRTSQMTRWHYPRSGRHWRRRRSCTLCLRAVAARSAVWPNDEYGDLIHD